MSQNQATTADDFFIPNFCSSSSAFLVIIIAELLAIIITLVPGHFDYRFWEQLWFTSTFVQWIAILSAISLCLSRCWLATLNTIAATITAFSLLLLVTLATTLVTSWLIEHFSLTNHLPQLAVDLDSLLRNLAISAIASAVALRYFFVQHQAKLNLVAENSARIQALQSRIRPHFLFNSLNTILSMVRTRPEIAEQAIENLATLFRASFGDAREQVALETELQLCRDYLAIEQLRLGDRLQVVWDIETAPIQQKIPALLLQPLVENAVYHGIEPSKIPATITLSARVNGKFLELCVSNPLPDHKTNPARQGHQIAQENVRQRLFARYGIKDGFRIEHAQGNYSVTLRLPLDTTSRNST